MTDLIWVGNALYPRWEVLLGIGGGTILLAALMVAAAAGIVASFRRFK